MHQSIVGHRAIVVLVRVYGRGCWCIGVWTAAGFFFSPAFTIFIDAHMYVVGSTASEQIENGSERYIKNNIELDGISLARIQIKVDNKIKNRNQMKYNREYDVSAIVDSEDDGSFDATIYYT